LRQALTAEARAEAFRRFTWPNVISQYRQLIGLSPELPA